MTGVRHQEGLLPSIAKDIDSIRKKAYDIIKAGRVEDALAIRNLTLELDLKMDKLVMDINKMVREAAGGWDKP